MRGGRLLIVLALVAALAGCSEIPTTGAVQAGATQAPNGTTLVYVANPPAQGASQQDIVNGFLAAMSAGGRFAVAKEYLTQAFADKWQPHTRVLVQVAQSKVTSNSTSAISLSVPITAEVGSNGVYSPRSAPESLDFHLTQVAGQWRIDRAPNGVVLTSPVFQKFYRPYALQFFDPTWKRLVPDLRWFLVSSSAKSVPSTRSIVDGLIAGPVGPIGGGVTANALTGATVQGIGPSGADVTTVTLTVAESDPSAELTARMQQQLIQSLKLPTPGSLRLVLNERVVPPVAAVVSPAPVQAAYVLSGGAFGELSPTGTFTQDPKLGRRIAAVQPVAVTVSEGQGFAAVLTPSRQVAIVGTSRTEVLAQSAPQIAPSVDQSGWVYSIARDRSSGLEASNAKGRTVAMSADLPGTSVTSIEVSPDGTRMLVLVATGANGTPAAFVAGIERGADGAPTGLTSAHYPVDLGGTTGTGIGATWVDDGDVAVLVLAPDGSADRVQLQQLGGTSSAVGAIPGASSIVGTSSQADLRVLQAGKVLVPSQQLWQEESAAAPDVSVLAVQR